nr:short integuments 2, mitochondrial isoform X1 [Tanacetum cinerariifolium]
MGGNVTQKILKKQLGDMSFATGGGTINWFPGHMAAATRAINSRLKLADLVIEVRDSRIPLSSANQDLQPRLSTKRRIIALNKKELANPNIMHKWVDYFGSCKQDCLPINAHSRSSVQKGDHGPKTRPDRNRICPKRWTEDRTEMVRSGPGQSGPVRFPVQQSIIAGFFVRPSRTGPIRPRTEFKEKHGPVTGPKHVRFGFSIQSGRRSNMLSPSKGQRKEFSVTYEPVA